MDVTEISLQDLDSTRAGTNAYRDEAPQVSLGQKMHEVPSRRMAELIKQVVAIEGPIHVDKVVVCLRMAWRLQPAGSRIEAAVERARVVGEQREWLVRDGAFLSVPGQVVAVRERIAAASPAGQARDAAGTEVGRRRPAGRPHGIGSERGRDRGRGSPSDGTQGGQHPAPPSGARVRGPVRDGRGYCTRGRLVRRGERGWARKAGRFPPGCRAATTAVRPGADVSANEGSSRLRWRGCLG